jgi:hypothetical protein
MNGEAEAWLEGAYPQLYGQWRHAYLKPAARQQDQAGDLCRICYIRQVTQNLEPFCFSYKKHAKAWRNWLKIKTFGFPRNITNIFMKLFLGKRTEKGQTENSIFFSFLCKK